MSSTIKIKELGNTEIDELNELIPVFVEEFLSANQIRVRNDFESITNSKIITMRVLCKLSEWCNGDDPGRRAGRDLAIQISKILFGDKIPELDSYTFKIDDGKIIINL